jgi:hypothetical protein
MTDDDTMDVLTVLLALALLLFTWVTWMQLSESTWRALVAPFEVKAPASAPSPTIIV